MLSEASHVEVDGERAGGLGNEIQLARAAGRYGRGEVVPVQVDFARLVGREVDADVVTLGDAQIIAGQGGIPIDDGRLMTTPSAEDWFGIPGPDWSLLPRSLVWRPTADAEGSVGSMGFDSAAAPHARVETNAMATTSATAGR